MKLQEKYLPLDYKDFVFEELLSLRQRNSTVDEYTHRFHKLCICSSVVETERQSITRYKAGLREDIRKELITVCLVNIDEAYQFALRLEQQLKSLVMRRPTTGWGNATPHNYMCTNKATGLMGDKSNTKSPLPSNKVVPDYTDQHVRMATGKRGIGTMMSIITNMEGVVTFQSHARPMNNGQYVV